MRYANLREIFYTQEATGGEHLQGFIRFSAENFPGNCPEEARTYIFSSQNQAFLPIENGDGSILAFTVDHSKKNFPIDQYIEEEWKTGEHWKIESCGLEKYLVMRAIERDVSCIGLFSSCQEAEKAMLEDFCRVSDIPLKKVEARYYEETNELLDDEDNEFGFVQGEVWYNGSDNYDWKIERLLID